MNDDIKAQFPIGLSVEIIQSGSVQKSWVGLHGVVHAYTTSYIRIQFERSSLEPVGLAEAATTQSFYPCNLRALSSTPIYTDPLAGTEEWADFERFAQKLYDAERLPMDKRDIREIESLRRDAAKARRFLDTKRRSIAES